MPDIEEPVDPYPLFSKQPRIYAFTQQAVAAALADESIHAPLKTMPLRADSETIMCIAGGRDQTGGSLVLRALLYPGTATLTPLTDGRLAYRGYWTLAAIAAVEAGAIDASELTENEFAELREKPSM